MLTNCQKKKLSDTTEYDKTNSNKTIKIENVGLKTDEDNGGLFLPDGFGALVVADSVGPSRHLAVNDNGDILAVSSVSTGTAGKVEIFVRASTSNDDSVQHAFTHVQTLTGATSDGSKLNTKFGDSMTMSKDGTTLIVGAPGLDNSEQADACAIYYYKWYAYGDSTLSYT